jgi:hypothetical protein
LATSWALSSETVSKEGMGAQRCLRGGFFTGLEASLRR